LGHFDFPKSNAFLKLDALAINQEITAIFILSQKMNDEYHPSQLLHSTKLVTNSFETLWLLW
jgi:hypothetical protein